MKNREPYKSGYRELALLNYRPISKVRTRPLKSVYNLKELTPDTHFYMALYSSFSDFMGITFTRPVFLFKIDHDDGTVKHFLSHFLDRYERSNDSPLIYEHIGRHCIN